MAACIHEISTFRRSFGAVLVALVLTFAGAARSASACSSEGAIGFERADFRQDGIFRIDGAVEARLAGVIWPDRQEARSRAALVAAIEAALAGQKLGWKAAGLPDRWGVTPVHLFVREPEASAPFWLQAGLVERGLVPVWPDGLGTDCLVRLELHERRAIALRRGYWAARAQAARLARLTEGRSDETGRRLSIIIAAGGVRPWRNLHFLNRAEDQPGRLAKRFSIAIPNAIISELTRSGDNPRDWSRHRVLIRAVLPPEGLARLRVETIERIRRLGPVSGASTSRL